MCFGGTAIYKKCTLRLGEDECECFFLCGRRLGYAPAATFGLVFDSQFLFGFLSRRD